MSGKKEEPKKVAAQPATDPKLEKLMEDLNGTALASGGHAEWGFIDEAWYIQIPAGFEVPATYDVGKKFEWKSEKFFAFFAANFSSLLKVCKSKEEAFFLAMLRTKIAQCNVLCKDPKARNVLVDEYAYDATFTRDTLSENYPEDRVMHAITKYVGQFFGTIVQQLVYTFLARGHHWQPEFDSLYNRLKSACFMTSIPHVPNISNENLYRNALHGFGVSPLYDLAKNLIEDGKVLAPMSLRFVPSPPVAGVAHFTTTMAVFNAMKSETWWGVFETRFQKDIDMIQEMVSEIHKRPLRYHVAAPVLTGEARLMPAAEYEQAFKNICQYVLGYLHYLGNRNILAGQKAITKAANGLLGVGLAFADACEDFNKPSFVAEDMDQWLQGIRGIIPREIQEKRDEAAREKRRQEEIASTQNDFMKATMQSMLAKMAV